MSNQAIEESGTSADEDLENLVPGLQFGTTTKNRAYHRQIWKGRRRSAT